MSSERLGEVSSGDLALEPPDGAERLAQPLLVAAGEVVRIHEVVWRMARSQASELVAQPQVEDRLVGLPHVVRFGFGETAGRASRSQPLDRVGLVQAELDGIG